MNKLAENLHWMVSEDTIERDIRRAVSFSRASDVNIWCAAYFVARVVGAYKVNVSRPSKYGNPYRVGRDGTAAECKDKYRRLIEGNIWNTPNRLDVQKDLRGKNLMCWCPLNTPCHRDVLLEIANLE